MSDRWFKVQTSIVRNEKVLSLTRTQRWALIELWAAATEDLNDGIISRTYCDKIVGKKIRNVLVENGFLCWIEDDKTLHIHDYLEHQRSRAEVLELSEKRRQAGRRGGKVKSKTSANNDQTASNMPSKTSSKLPPEIASKNEADPDPDPEILTHLRDDVTFRDASASAREVVAGEFSDGSPIPPDPGEPHSQPHGALAVAPEPVPAHIDAAPKPPPVTPTSSAQTLVRITLGTTYPATTRTRLARQIDRLIRDNQPENLIRAALTEWDQRPNCDRPEYLPTVLSDVVSRQRAGPPRSAVSDKVSGWLALGNTDPNTHQQKELP